MGVAQDGEWVVDVCLSTSIAAIDLIRSESMMPEQVLVADFKTHNLVLGLSPGPGNVRVRYRDHWPPDRFEAVGRVFLLPAGEAMQFRSMGGPRRALVCRLRADAVRSWFDVSGWSERALEASLDITSPQVGALLRRIADEAYHPGLASETLVETIVTQLAIEVGRYFAAVAQLSPGGNGGLAPERLQLIDRRLTDAGRTPTLAELAEDCGLSVRQLTRGFRASRGHSIGEHVARVKIEAAKRMIANQASIGEVAQAMGFASASAFSFAFRRATGETPRRFRQRVG